VNELDKLKDEFIEGYVDMALDRLLALRGNIKLAKTETGVKLLMAQERAWNVRYFGLDEEKEDNAE